MEDGDIQQLGNHSQDPWSLPGLLLFLFSSSKNETCAWLVLGPRCERLNQEGGRFDPSPDMAGNSLAMSRSKVLVDTQAW